MDQKSKDEVFDSLLRKLKHLLMWIGEPERAKFEKRMDAALGEKK